MTPELILALALTAVDASQTEYLTRHYQPCQGHEGRYEENPLLGRHPSQIKVAAWFGANAGALMVANQYLPPAYSKALNYVWIGAEGATVAHNLRVGVRFSF
jgi:hypothetical protein